MGRELLEICDDVRNIIIVIIYSLELDWGNLSLEVHMALVGHAARDRCVFSLLGFMHRSQV